MGLRVWRKRQLPIPQAAQAVAVVADTSLVHLSPVAVGGAVGLRSFLTIVIMPLENLVVVMADKVAAILVLTTVRRPLPLKLSFMAVTLRPPTAVAAMAQCLETMVKAQESALALSL